MIKFFKNIRKNSLNQGKITSYLKYAIGEIVLVVIGILIALSINNWNEIRKEALAEQIIIKNLNTEFIGNQNFIADDIAEDIKSIESGKELMSLIGAKQNLLETKNIDSLIFTVFESSHLSATDNSIIEIIQTGKLQYLKNPNLKNLIISWTQLKTQTLNVQETKGDKGQELVKYLYTRYPIKNIDAYGILQWKSPSNLVTNKYLIFNELEFENIIDDLLYNNTNYHNKLVETQSLINLIVNETNAN